ncbi:MAG: ABC transporter permease [Promethearchaeota archaeon]
MTFKKSRAFQSGWTRFFTLVQKELALIFSDKQALLMIFILPIMALTAVGITSQGSEDMIDMLSYGRPVKLGVVNLDTSVGDPDHVLSEEFISILAEQPFTTVIRYDSVLQADEDLYYEKVIGYVIINDGFETNVSTHLPAIVEFYTNDIDILSTPLVAKKINDAIQEFKAKFNFLEDEIYYQTDEMWKINSPVFLSMPMVVTTTLLASALMLAVQSVVGDNPLMRVTLTPASRFEIVSGKIFAYIVLHMIQALILLGYPMIVFNIRYKVNFLVVWGYSVFVIFAGASMGSFLSSISKTKLQGSQMFIVGFMALFIFGSGAFIQSEILVNIFPMIHNEEGFILLAYKGRGIAEIWPTIWPQVIYAMVFYVLTYIIIKFKKDAI